MKKKTIVIAVFTPLLTFSTYILKAQITTPTNISPAGVPFVGWNGTGVSRSLVIRNNFNRSIEWYTDGGLFRKMVLNPDLTGQNVNGYGGLDLSGFFGVGEFSGGMDYSDPAARVHANGGSTTDLGFRPMMKDGFLATRGESLFYGGLLNNTESGIVWSFRTLPGGSPPVPLKFIYTGDDGTTSVSTGIDGLELGRFQAHVSNDHGYFGIGDWTNSLGGQIPEERLDILDRTIRLRAFAASSLVDWENSFDRVLVADPLDGTVYWRDASTLGGGGGDYDWEVIGSDVVSGHGTSGFPSNSVGIGNVAPKCKLDVLLQANPAGYQPIAICGYNSSEVDALNIGVSGVAIYRNCDPSQFSPQTYIGGSFQGLHAEYNFGVQGVANANPVCSNSKQNIGVYGEANGASTNWAGYFNGISYLGGVIIGSDQALKTNVSGISDALGMIDLLAPKKYDFLVNDFPHMNLPDGMQYGLIAQDVESIIPELTTPFTSPAVYDSLGAVVTPPADYLGINYIGLIPILIQGIKDQQEQIDALQTIVMDCCSSFDGMQGPNGSDGGGLNDMNSKQSELHQNRPNPFKTNTRIDYDLVADGNVELIITDINGVQIEKLVNKTQSAGSYSLDWNTEDLSPGIYFYSLIVDGQLWIKKAIKIQ